jgi:hypothetical protein
MSTIASFSHVRFEFQANARFHVSRGTAATELASGGTPSVDKTPVDSAARPQIELTGIMMSRVAEIAIEKARAAEDFPTGESFSAFFASALSETMDRYVAQCKSEGRPVRFPAFLSGSTSRQEFHANYVRVIA